MSVQHRHQTLIRTIQDDVLDGSKPLAGILRKCIALGGEVGSVPLREWASKELRGYGKDDELPPYRTVGASILVNYVNGYTQVSRQRISPQQLPDGVREHIGERVPVRWGVGEVEAAVSRAEQPGVGYIDLTLPMGADVANWMTADSDDEFLTYMAVYWSASVTTFHGLLDQIRTTLTELTTELVAATPEYGGLPSPEAAAQALNVAVNGKGHRITVNAAQASGGAIGTVDHGSSTTEDPGFWTTSRKIGAFVVGLATVVAAVVGIAQLFAALPPKGAPQPSPSVVTTAP